MAGLPEEKSENRVRNEKLSEDKGLRSVLRVLQTELVCLFFQDSCRVCIKAAYFEKGLFIHISDISGEDDVFFEEGFDGIFSNG